MVRFSILRVVGAVRTHSIVAFLLSLAVVGSASPETQAPEREVFVPASGRGSIVIAVSGQSGPALYRDYSARLAEHGYYVVLVSGNDISIPGKTGPASRT